MAKRRNSSPHWIVFVKREPLFNIPPVVIAVLALLALIHGVRTLLLSDDQDIVFLLSFAFIPARYDTSVVLGGALPGGFGADIWTFVTYSLIHADWTHFSVNAVWLLPFGSAVARRFGALRFIAFFAVTAAAGADILTHAIESYTTRPYDARPKHYPPDRPAYIGANPASDVWCEKAIELVGRYLRRAVLNGLDLEARLHLALAANYAGIGFGNAGVHIPHAVAYPIAGLVRDYVPSGYRTRHPLIPHGMSVILTAPAAFRFTYTTAPERHLRAAELMGVPVRDLSDAERREALPRALATLMRDIGIPNGLAAVGYAPGDVPSLIAGTLKQPRLLSGAPRLVGAAELEGMLEEAMRIW